MEAYLKARSEPVVTFLERFLDMLQKRFGTARCYSISTAHYGPLRNF
jgi:hypothetical protein